MSNKITRQYFTPNSRKELSDLGKMCREIRREVAKRTNGLSADSIFHLYKDKSVPYLSIANLAECIINNNITFEDAVLLVVKLKEDNC